VNNSRVSIAVLSAAFFQAASIVLVLSLIMNFDTEGRTVLIGLAWMAISAQVVAGFSIVVAYSERAIERTLGGGLVQRR
jgi:hypothetical protein